MISINDLAKDINGWANSVFPDRTMSDIIIKSFEEFGEVIRNPDDPLEMADLFILLLDLAVIRGFDIEKAIIDKMRVNTNRKWKVDSHTRIMRHIDG